MARAIWKGAISFGLVHVPVSLHSGASDTGIDFDWIDKRSMDPVGYKRVNKRTGKEIDRENIVKGVKTDGGDYVIIGEDEIRAAYPKTTQTIEIEGFVEGAAIPFAYLEKPYYLEPAAKAEKVYALLREAMSAAGVVGVARIVMHSKEHLAALIPAGPALVLNTLRWSNEIRDIGDLSLPAAGKSAANLKDAELKMAERLIGDMTVPWDPSKYTDRFADAVHALVKKRIAAGKTETIEPMEAHEEPKSNVLDLTELLKQSLGKRTASASARSKGAAANDADAAAPAAKKVAKKTVRKKAA